MIHNIQGETSNDETDVPSFQIRGGGEREREASLIVIFRKALSNRDKRSRNPPTY